MDVPTPNLQLTDQVTWYPPGRALKAAPHGMGAAASDPFVSFPALESQGATVATAHSTASSLSWRQSGHSDTGEINETLATVWQAIKALLHIAASKVSRLSRHFTQKQDAHWHLWHLWIAKAQSAPSIAQATEERQGEQRFCDSPSQVCSDPNRCWKRPERLDYWCVWRHGLIYLDIFDIFGRPSHQQKCWI